MLCLLYKEKIKDNVKPAFSMEDKIATAEFIRRYIIWRRKVTSTK